MSRPAPHTLSAEDLFPADYYAGRDAFLAAATDAGARIVSVEHPTAKGPGNRPLWMDAAVLGPADAPFGLGFVSATHGPEGYVGSAAQTGFFRSDLVERSRGFRTIVVHAHNPYGYAWDTRFNEDNIDLNRNYIDFDAGDLPINAGYEELAAAIAPPSITDEALQEADRRLLTFAMARGYPALQAAMTAGQYSHPLGLYWGGAEPSWSRRTLYELLVRPLMGARQAIVIDWHTGLGPPGYGEVICEKAPGTPEWDRAQAIFRGECRSTKDGSSASAELAGTMDVAVERWLAPTEATCVALEFGTVELREVFGATRVSSWLHTRGQREGPEADAIRARSKAAFCLDAPEWRHDVWTRAAWAMDCAISALERA